MGRLVSIAFASCVALGACTAGEGLEAVSYNPFVDKQPTRAKDAGKAAAAAGVDASVYRADTMSRTSEIPRETDGGAVTPTVDAGPTSACGHHTTFDACANCCDALFPQGPRQCENQWTQAFGDCNCAPGGRCSDVCFNTYCAGYGAVQGSLCDGCLATSNQCASVADKAAPECGKLDACYRTSACNAKP